MDLQVRVDDTNARAGLAKMREGVKAAIIGVLVGPTVRYGRIQEARRHFLAGSLSVLSGLPGQLAIAIPEGRGPTLAAMYGGARKLATAASGRAPRASGELSRTFKVIGKRGGGR